MFSSRADNPSRSSSWSDIVKDASTILGGAAIVFAALLWYLGRKYGHGYFESMNIPLFQLTFSIWEYGEVSLSQVLTAFVGLVFFVGLMVVRSRGRPLLQDIFLRLPLALKGLVLLVGLGSLIIIFIKTGGSVTSFTVGYILLVVSTLSGFSCIPQFAAFRKFGNAPARPRGFERFLSLTMTIYVALMLFLLLGQGSYETGRKAGTIVVTQRAVRVRLVLAGPLFADLESHHLVNNSAHEQLYIYENLRLLTYNDKRYFLFDELDGNCTPKRVFIIREEDTRTVEYSKPDTISCK
jgi:hypothetical protein